jgi:hypothetical protein
MLEDCSVRDYQILDHSVSKNKIGDPRFDTPTWPGYSIAFLIQINEQEKVDELMLRLKKFNKDEAFNESELLVVATWELKNYFYGKEFQG